MPTPIGYGNLSRELAKRIPALRDDVERQFLAAGGEDPGPHVVFGDVFVPWLEELLSKPDTNAEILIAFELLEEMAQDPDQRVQEVVQMTVCEDLLSSPELFLRARSLMRPTTQAFSRQIERFWEKVRGTSNGRAS